MERRIIKTILYALAAIVVFIGTLYILNGSLESFPTEEQQGKARMAAVLIILFGLIIGMVGVLIRPKR